jgi:hypothetical protein
MENLSTENYAETIIESLTNGQRKQALQQFANALEDHVNAKALLLEIAWLSDSETALQLAASHIENKGA